MRPLYIEAVTGCKVIFDEPALRVIVPNKADQLFPLARISRVVCKGMVDWSMAALLACADAGINLLFLGHDGELRARWLGQGDERQSLTQRLVDLLSRADGLQRYENWYLSMEKLAARSFARRMGLVEWREVSIYELRRQVALGLSAAGVYRANLLLALLHSELLVFLPVCGFCGNDEALLSSELNLASDISRLLLWDYYPALLKIGTTAHEGDFAAMAQLYQQRSERFMVLTQSTVNKLHQFLLGLD